MRYGRTIGVEVERSAREAGHAAERRSAGRRSARRIERGHLLLGVRPQGGLRELVEDPLVGLDGLLGPVELLGMALTVGGVALVSVASRPVR